MIEERGLKPVFELDGRNLYYTFVAGAQNILENQKEINRINVYPVNDHDTGTNLASTIRSVLDNISPNKSYKHIADQIAEAALVGARGNSGIIFAQFLYGVSIETQNKKNITISEFAQSLKNSIQYIYDAIANPVEGTMLTVIREWADFVYSKKNIFKDFNQLFIDSGEIIKNSLQNTKSKLDVLSKNNIVDAGAKGFVVFIEGIIDFIISDNIKQAIRSQNEEINIQEEFTESIPDVITFRFCTEAIIKKPSIDKDSLKTLLADYGDSVVVAGSDKIYRLHVHTNTPADLFQDIKDYGTISFQKADDMVRQSEVTNNRKWNIALVTDSTCDIPEEILEKYQIHVLPINLNFGDNHYLDKVTIKPEQFYKQLDESKVFPNSSLINEKSFVNLYSHLASNYDSIISIHIADKLSGTYFNATKAAEKISTEFNTKISVIDSQTITGPLGLLVYRIALSIAEGTEHDRIINQIEEWKGKVDLFASVKTLKYLVRGGRVSPMKGLFAKLAHINPVIHINTQGEIVSIDKAFTKNRLLAKVMNYIKNSIGDKEIWNYFILHTNSQENADWYATQMKNLTGKEPLSIINISPVIGMHVGYGAAAVAFMKN